MRQPQQPPQQQEAQDRKPGRSFDDPTKPMGEGILERSGASETAKEDFRPREEQAGATHNGVAERAKVIGVLRKAEELMAEGNLPKGQETAQRALELAAGRVGLTIEEYYALVKGDPELEQLQAKVFGTQR